MLKRPGTGGSALRRSRSDPTAFIDFYEAYSRRLLVYFTRRVLDAEVAMDLTSETFATAYESRRHFRGSTAEQEQGYLFAIARSKLGAFWSRGRAEKDAIRRLGIEVPVMTDAELERIEELAEVQTIARDLAHAMERLPADQADAVRLRVMEELSYDDIAANLEIEPDTARARVSRGLRALSAHVREAEVEYR